MSAADRVPDPSRVIPGKAACLAVATAATALYLHGTGLGEAGRFVTHAQHAVADAIVGPQLYDAAIGLQRYHDLSGTYAGATVGGRQMELEWGNDASYCIEGVSEANGVQHLVGPNGRIGPGSCPHWGF
jgi:hypothetical protein